MNTVIKNFIFIKRGLFILLFVSILAACSDNNINTTIKVSLLPDTSKEQLNKRYRPLLDYITEKTGIHFKLILSDSYDDLYTKFITGEIDFAYFGGVTYVKAHLKTDAEPLVFRDTDERFYSVVLVRKDHPAKQLADLKNTHFGFGSKLSTSGHLMPRYFFSNQNITPENFFNKVIFTGSHQKTASMVQNNEITAGVANAEIVTRMFNDGRLNKQKVRILWTSPPFPDYVWAIQTNISSKIKNKIREAFLSLNKAKPEHANILKKVGAQYFLPATHENFSILEDTLKKFNRVKQ